MLHREIPHGNTRKRTMSIMGVIIVMFLICHIPKVRNFINTQLPGRLFSPSDISKKLSHHFLLHFSIGITVQALGSYDRHAKYQSVFMGLL